MRGDPVILVGLSVLLVLVLGGCVCVVRAARGGPRWARGVAKGTLLAGELLRAGSKGRSGSGGNSEGDGD
ncbi:hypothetical protein ACH4CD_19755 [Streptomyces fungicidicus]|uniref:hypothetical protein n=1 Tax=Streptomyces fungicidicus TaxID=68203 RepID=UPI0037AA15DD